MPALPNTEALLGLEVTTNLISKAGGVGPLCRLTDSALRHLGSEDYASSTTWSTLSSQLHGGFLIESPLFRQFFIDDNDEVLQGLLHSAKKGLSILSKKALLTLKTDAAGGSSDGSLGTTQFNLVKDAFARLLSEGKVDIHDTQALPVPQIIRKGEKKARRGGQKEQKRRRLNDGTSLLETALSRVKMGVSEEEQREQLLQRDDIRIQILKEQERIANKDRKREREDNNKDYDDLLSLQF